MAFIYSLIPFKPLSSIIYRNVTDVGGEVKLTVDMKTKYLSIMVFLNLNCPKGRYKLMIVYHL